MLLVAAIFQTLLVTANPADDTAIVKWLKASAIPLVSVQAGSGFKDLEPFAKSLKGVRIVGMGEPTHGTREAFLFKHRMFEFLVETQGYRVFAIEASYPECLPIENYIQTGTGDPESVVHGQGFWTWDNEELLGLVQWMRAYNVAHKDRVHFVGFDMQSKAPAYDLAQKYLTSRLQLKSASPSASLVELFDDNRDALVKQTGKHDYEIARQCAVVARQAAKNESTNGTANIQALVKVLARAQADATVLDKTGWQAPGLKEVLQRVDDDIAGESEVTAVVTRLQKTRESVPKPSLVAYDAELTDLVELAKCLGIVEAMSGWRDRCMADNTAWIVDKLFPGSKAMLWAHNYHIGSSVPEDNLVATMGHHLARQFGRTYFPVGFSFGQGAFQSRLLSSDAKMGPLQSFQLGPPKAGSLDDVLSKAGSLYIAAFDHAPADARMWLGQPHATRTCGAGYDPTHPEAASRKDRPGKWYRAMVFLGQTTRARPLRLARERFGITKDW